MLLPGLSEAVLTAIKNGSTHVVVKVERSRAPRTQPGAQGVLLARPRIVGRYLGEGHRPGVHVYDVAVADLERLLRSAAL